MKPPRLDPKASDATIQRALVAYATASAGEDKDAFFVVQQLEQVRAKPDDRELLFRAIMRGLIEPETVDWYVHAYIRS